MPLQKKNKYDDNVFLEAEKAKFNFNGQYYSKKEIILVNENFPVSKFYNPGINKEAMNSYDKMAKEANNQGIKLSIISAYRSYEEQEKIYESYKKENTNYDEYSAKPGNSEHQIGLAFDIGGENPSLFLKNEFAYTKESLWLYDNSYKYGFINRYPKGKEQITKKQYEPWHYRYVGHEHATKIFESKKSLEEYLFEEGD